MYKWEIEEYIKKLEIKPETYNQILEHLDKIAELKFHDNDIKEIINLFSKNDNQIRGFVSSKYLKNFQNIATIPKVAFDECFQLYKDKSYLFEMLGSWPEGTYTLLGNEYIASFSELVKIGEGMTGSMNNSMILLALLQHYEVFIPFTAKNMNINGLDITNHTIDTLLTEYKKLQINSIFQLLFNLECKKAVVDFINQQHDIQGVKRPLTIDEFLSLEDVELYKQICTNKEFFAYIDCGRNALFELIYICMQDSNLKKLFTKDYLLINSIIKKYNKEHNIHEYDVDYGVTFRDICILGIQDFDNLNRFIKDPNKNIQLLLESIKVNKPYKDKAFATVVDILFSGKKSFCKNLGEPSETFLKGIKEGEKKEQYKSK